MQIILDSLIHPTINGKWITSSKPTSFAHINELISIKDIKYFACAVGISGISNYSHDTFMKECKKYSNLIPIAGINPELSSNLDTELHYIQELGYKGIKIHPKLNNLSFTSKKLDILFKKAANLNLPIFLCTYNYQNSLNMLNNNFQNLVKLINSNLKTKIVLLHGGDVEIKKYMELVRSNKNLILDLSFTILKYKGSSLDLDLKYLFNNFDQRICIGSDYPDFTPLELIERIDELSNNISNCKKDNITLNAGSSYISDLMIYDLIS